MYEVVYPLGKPTPNKKPVASRLKSLEGATIAAISNHKYHPDLTFDTIERALAKRFPGIKMIPHREFGDTYGPHEAEVISALPEKLKAFKVDAVISGNAG